MLHLKVLVLKPGYAKLIDFTNATLSDVVFEDMFLDLVALNRNPTADDARYTVRTVAVSMVHVPTGVGVVPSMSSGGLVLMMPFGPSIDMSR